MNREDYDCPENFDRLIVAANNYYNGRDTGMDDFEYDHLMDEIKSQNPSFSIFDYVRYDTDSEKRRHTITFPNFEKVEFNRVLSEGLSSDISLTCKYDGCSIVAYYDRNGELQNIMTRSNEIEGVVQTKKLWNKVPHKVNPDIRAILFECTVEGNRASANGLINSKYKQDEVDDKLFLNPFDCILWNRKLGYRKRMDLTGLHYDVVTIQQATLLKSMGDEPYIELEREGKIRKIPVDGIVAYGNVEPDFGRIYKFYSTESKTSIVTKLHFDPSPKTGLNSVVVEFEPVRIGSITVRRCGNAGSWKTIHEEKKLGVGSEVEVYLTKVTIPMIGSNTPRTEDTIPTCPWCGEVLTEFQSRLICMNQDCGFWEDFFATKYFDILREHLGDEWVTEFTVNGKFGIEMMAKAEKLTGYTLSKFITNPNYLLYLLKPAGVNGKVYEQVRQRILMDCQNYPPKNTFELVDMFFGRLYNPNQKEYCQTVWGKLAYFLRKANTVRKNLP